MKRIVFILLCLPLCVSGQSFADRMQSRLDDFYENHLPLKLHLLLNQETYAAGDTIFFSAALVSAEGHHPIEGRSIIHVQISFEGRVISEGMFSVTDGFGYNQLVIPKGLSPGKYTLTAFNEWMKNASPQLSYNTSIHIGKSDSPDSSDGALKIFPESGGLVTGLTSKIVVCGPKNTSYTVRSDSGESITSVALDSLGLGWFMLTPDAGKKYQLTGNSKEVVVPDAAQDGAVLMVTRAPKRNDLRIMVQVPMESQFRNTVLHLLISLQGQIIYGADMTLKSETYSNVSVTLPDVGKGGIAQVTLFSNDERVLANRLVFLEPPAPDVRIDTDQVVFGTGGKVTYSLNVGSTAISQFDLTVCNRSLTGAVDRQSRKEYFLLASDIGETRPGLLSTDRSWLHHYLVTRKWLRFDWGNLHLVPGKFKYIQDLRLAGTAILPDGSPVPESTLLSFFLQNTAVTYEAYSRAGGKFEFLMLFDFYGQDEVFLLAEHNGKKLEGVKILLENEEAQVPGRYEGPYTDGYGRFAAMRASIDRSYSFFLRKDPVENLPERRSSIEEEVDGPDLTVVLDDYLHFPTMRETLHEIIPLLKHRTIRGKDVVRLYNDEVERYPNQDPIFVVDGVMTDDVQYFLNLDPLQVATIKIVYAANKLKTFGALGKGGIILVDTKIPGNRKNVPRSESSLIIDGLMKRKEPSVKLYPHVLQGRVPDLRTNLAWMPRLQTNTDGVYEGRFFTSDVPGEYEIRVEGVTDSGELFEARKRIQIVFSAN